MSYLFRMLHAQKRCQEPFFPESLWEKAPDLFSEGEAASRPTEEALPQGIRSMEHWLDLNA